ncbi:MAG: hypothetical protein ACRCS3_06345 [Paracoccaceae bacterium]
MVVQGLKTKLERHQLHMDVREMCASLTADDQGAALLEHIAWRWVNAGYRNSKQLRHLLKLEGYYNGGLYAQAERLGLVGRAPPTYASYVTLLEAFDRG